MKKTPLKRRGGAALKPPGKYTRSLSVELPRVKQFSEAIDAISQV